MFPQSNVNDVVAFAVTLHVAFADDVTVTAKFVSANAVVNVTVFAVLFADWLDVPAL